MQVTRQIASWLVLGAIFFTPISPTEAKTHASAGVSVFNKAKNYVGIHERSGSKKLKKITKVNPARVPWCAAFINGVLKTVGIHGTGSLSAMSFAKYKKGTKKPHKGDIVVIKRKGGSGAHVALFSKFVKKNGRRYVQVLGGNQKNKVSIRNYPVAKVISYRKI